jgi:hypothetical protein
MSAPINRKQVNTTGTGLKPFVPLNRWGFGADISINIVFSGAATVTLEGTLDHVNREGVTDVFDIVNGVGITVDTALNITDTPLEAIRINQTAGTGSVTMHVMQGGACG